MNREEKPRQRRSDALINRLLETLLPTLFYIASALSAPSGHLPLEGKADDTRIPSSNMAAKPHPSPVEPTEPFEPAKPVGMSG